MSTTGVNFVLVDKTSVSLNGSAIESTPYLDSFESKAALIVTGRVPGGAAGYGALTTSGIANNGNFLCDVILNDLAKQGFAKNGAFHVTTSGTTPVTIDLTNLSTNATSQAGDATFATANQLTFYNTGTADMTISPGGSNPAPIPKFSGTSPTITVSAGSAVTVQCAAGATVTSSAKNLTVTPSSGGNFVMTVGGA